MRNDLIWEDYDEPIGDREVEIVEKKLGVKFPDDYIEVIKKYHGGTPDKNAFEFVDREIGETGSCIGILFSFNLENPSNIVDVYYMVEDQLPDGIIPISDDGGGDSVCFDMNNKNAEGEPTIVYWSHETEIDESITFLSNSFSEFLDMLFSRD